MKTADLIASLQNLRHTPPRWLWAGSGAALAFGGLMFVSGFLLSGFGDSASGEAVGLDLDDTNGEYAEPPTYDESTLRIVQATPAGDISVGDLKKEIVVVFNQPMIPLAKLANTPESTKGLFQIKPRPAGVFRWYGSRVLAFVPKEEFAPGAEYSVVVPAGIKSLSGKRLAQATRFEFATPPLKIVSSSPNPRYTKRIEYNKRFEVYFNYPIRLSTFQKQLKMTANNRPVAFQAVHPELNKAARSLTGPARVAAVQERQRRVLITPAKALPRDAVVRISLPRGFPPARGNRGLTESLNLEYRTYGPLTFSLFNKAQFFQNLWRLRIDFNNPVKRADVAKHIRVRPISAQGQPGDPVKMIHRDGGRTSSVSLDHWEIKPEQRYRISVSKTMVDAFGNKVRGARSFDVATPRLRRSFYSDTGVQAIEARMKQNLPIFVSGMSALTGKIGRFDLDALKRYAAAGYGGELAYEDAEDFQLQTNVPATLATRIGFDVSKYLQKDTRNWLAVNYSGKVEDWNGKPRDASYTRFVQVTDLGLVVKQGAGGAHAFVHSLSTAKAQAGVTVRGFDGKQSLGECKTNAQGYCQVRMPGRLVQPEKALYVAEAPEANGKRDRAFVMSRHHAVGMWSMTDNYNAKAARPSLHGQVIFDRKLYRPGDTVEIKAAVAVRENGRLHTDAAKLGKILLRVSNAKGKEILKKELRPSPEGGVWSSLKIPADAGLGHYSVRISSLALSKDSPNQVYDTFQIEEFRPVNFSVNGEGLGKPATIGQTLKLVVAGRYLFGAPMQNANVSYNVNRQPKSFHFERLPGFVFGDYDYGDSWDSSGFAYLSGGSGKLDQSGRLEMNLTLPNMPAKGLEKLGLQRSYELELEARVSDVNDQTVTNKSYGTVYAGTTLPGVKVRDYYNGAGQAFRFDLAAVNQQGQPMSATGEVLIHRKEWKSIEVKGPGESIQRQNTLIREQVSKKSVRLNAKPTPYSFTPQKAGNYTLTLRVGKAYSRVNFYVFGGGYIGWDFRNDDTIEILKDKSEYRPGETARLLIQSPFKRSQAVVTIEREGVYSTQTYELEGNGEPIEIPIKAEYVPDVYVSVMLIRPRIAADEKKGANGKSASPREDRGRPRFKMGVAHLVVDAESKRLPMTITSSSQQYGPGDTAELTIRTEPGAEVAVSVADRAVLDLIAYKFADPIARFYKNWPLGVGVIENRLSLIRQISYAIKGTRPGGKAADATSEAGGFAYDSEDGARKDFRHTAHWTPSVKADSSGLAVIKFQLPENLTTFRVQALAMKSGRYARGSHEFQVARDLVVQPFLPRFVRPGDQVEIGAVVTNQTGKRARFRVAMQSPLLKFTAAGGDTTPAARDAIARVVEIDAGAAKEVAFTTEVNGAAYRKAREEAAKRFAERVRNAKSDGSQTGREFDLEPATVKGLLSARLAGSSDSNSGDKSTFKFPVREQPPAEAFTIGGVAGKGGMEQSENAQSSEAIALPGRDEIVDGLGHLELSLSSTALTGVSRAFEFYRGNPYFCLEQRASAYMAALTSGEMLANLAEPPAGKSGYDFGQIEALFLNSLGEFQNKDGGFRVWKDSRPRSDPYLTAYIAFVLQSADEVRDGKPKYDRRIRSKAINYLQNYVKKPPRDGFRYILETMAFIHHVMVRDGAGDDGLEKFLLENEAKLSLRARAHLALALAEDRSIKNYTTDANTKRIIEYLRNRMEFTTRKVSFKEPHRGSYTRAYYAPGSTMGVILRAMLTLDPNNPLIPQMVQYSLGDQGSRLWRDSHSAGQLAYGLWHYGQKFESESPDFSAQIQLNNKELWRQKFAGRTDKAVSKRFPVSDLYKLANPKATVPFAFHKNGTGRLYYTASLSYAPSGTASQKARDEGIEVRREILLGDGETPAPESLKRGEVYLVRLTVVTPKPVFQFMLQDLLPASVEIVQTGFATESSSYDRFLRKKRREGGRNGYWWMASAPQYEYRDDRFLATQEYLSPGIHEFDYFARANVRGTVAHPAARAFAMYEPEVFGRTASGTARVQ